jgi:hypothetical protein
LQALENLETQLSHDVEARAATSAEIIARLARLANHFRGERPEDSWTMLFDDYAVALAGISLPHLEKAIAASVKGRSWFPKAADLVAIWEAALRLEREHLRRVRVLLGKEEPKPWERLHEHFQGLAA